MRRAAPYLLVVAIAAALVCLFTLQPFAHFDDYYFTPRGEPWWKGAVWGNVLAILPSAPVLFLIGLLGWYVHSRAIAPLHQKIDQGIVEREALHTKMDRAAEERQHLLSHLKALADAIDPDTESDTQLDRIADRVDETTPGGLGTIAALLSARPDKKQP